MHMKINLQNQSTQWNLPVKTLLQDLTKRSLLNQARASLWPAHTWFLKIDPVWIVSIHVCVSTPEAINNQWCDMAWYEAHMIG